MIFDAISIFLVFVSYESLLKKHYSCKDIIFLRNTQYVRTCFLCARTYMRDVTILRVVATEDTPRIEGVSNTPCLAV